MICSKDYVEKLKIERKEKEVCFFCKKVVYRNEGVNLPTEEHPNNMDKFYYFKPIGFMCKHHDGVEDLILKNLAERMRECM